MKDPAPEKGPSIAMAKIEVWLAGVLMILAFAVGFLVRGVTNEPSAPAQQQPITGVPGALTDSQVQGGTLPPGHPAVVPGQTVPGVTGASPTKAGGNKDRVNQNTNDGTP